MNGSFLRRCRLPFVALFAATLSTSSCGGGYFGWKRVASDAQRRHLTREYAWEDYTLGPGLEMAALSVSADGQRIWAIGKGGAALRSVNGGKNWTRQTLQADGKPIVADLLKIAVSRDGAIIWIIGSEGLLINSADGGMSWTRKHVPEAAYPWSIAGTGDGRELWLSANSGSLLHSDDAGGTWKIIQNSHRFYGIVDIESDDTATNLLLIEGVPSYTSPIDVSTDKGRNWKALKPLERARSITATADAIELWATGEDDGNAIHYSNNAGASWARIILPNGMDGSPVGVHASPDAANLYVLSKRGTLLIGKTVGYYSEIVEARLVNTATRTSLEFRLTPDQTTLSAKKDAVILDILAANPFNAKDERRYDDLRDSANDRFVHRRPDSDIWQTDLDPTKVGVKPGESIYLSLSMMQGNSTQAYQTVDFVYQSFWFRNKEWLLPCLGVVTIPLVLGLLLIIRPLWVLRLYQRLPMFELVDHIPAGGLASLLKLLAKATLLPSIVSSRPVVDAWVKEHLGAAAEHFAAHDSVKNRALYLASPVSIGSRDHGTVIPEPRASDFRNAFAARSCVIEICGAGGSGKSTLAFRMAQWAIADDPEQRLSDHQMIPILIEDNFQNIAALVKTRVTAWFGEDIDATFIAALLRLKRILIIVDGVSERDEATRRYLAQIHGTEPVNALICTSRYETTLLAGNTVRVYPLPLTEGSVLHFATGLIRARARNGLLNIDLQVEFAVRLAQLVTRTGPAGAITPLLVTLAVMRAGELADHGRELSELPTSIPELYFDYLRRLNRSGDSQGDLEVAERLGRLALQPAFVPNEFSGRKVRDLWEREYHPPFNPAPYLARLVDNGVLIRRPSGTDEMFRFVLDPVAEMLAAVSWARECGADVQGWRELFAQGSDDQAAGFLSALRLVHATYWQEQGWPRPLDLQSNGLKQEAAPPSGDNRIQSASI